MREARLAVIVAPAPKKDAKSPAPAASAPSNPIEAVQQAAAQAWSMPWQLAQRAAETQTAAVDEWRRNLLSLAGQSAVFKTRVQKSGRVSIPDAEREALGIDEGDLVQVVVIPLNKTKKE